MMISDDEELFGGIESSQESEEDELIIVNDDEHVGAPDSPDGESVDVVEQPKRGRPKKEPVIDVDNLYSRLMVRVGTRLKEIYHISYSQEVKEKCLEILSDLELINDIVKNRKVE
ncbi:hypothetical protein Mjas_01485 [Methanothermococcus sp. Ax23]|uniref:hypothetical protein n=1 Tax=Methanothermococcus sp. Ax23 TaxID=3156486 RepID=UPI003BA10B41